MSVSGFVLKTTRELQCNARASRSIGFFPILSRSESELVLGVDDRHLDFKLSILIRASDGEIDFDVVATTVVDCHNNFGRAYLTLIKPFHVLVVRSNLNRALETMAKRVSRSSIPDEVQISPPAIYVVLSPS